MYIFSNVALPLVSRVMFSASKIGTPLATSVPSVRVVRARMFFSIRLPKIGTLMMNWSQPIRPWRNLRISLIVSQIVTGMPGIKYQYLHAPVRNANEQLGHGRQLEVEFLEDFSERGHDLDHDERQDARRRP